MRTVDAVSDKISEKNGLEQSTRKSHVEPWYQDLLGTNHRGKFENGVSSIAHNLSIGMKPAGADDITREIMWVLSVHGLFAS
jgi:hypothetical protein